MFRLDGTDIAPFSTVIEYFEFVCTYHLYYRVASGMQMRSCYCMDAVRLTRHIERQFYALSYTSHKELRAKEEKRASGTR